METVNEYLEAALNEVNPVKEEKLLREAMAIAINEEDWDRILKEYPDDEMVKEYICDYNSDIEDITTTSGIAYLKVDEFYAVVASWEYDHIEVWVTSLEDAQELLEEAREVEELDPEED